MATKKPGPKPVLRTKILKYLEKHPNAKAAEVAAKCGCKVGYVYTVRSKAKAEPKPVKPMLKPVEPAVPEPSFFSRLKEFFLLVWRGK